MRITNAVYQLSEIRRVKGEACSSRRCSQRPEQHDPTGSIPVTVPTAPPATPSEEISSLKEMLREHFLAEVRRRDRDQDGRLSPREFGGSRAEFEKLDQTGKGYLNAEDLTREALARSPELREIVTGRWTPVFEALLRVDDASEENLLQAVRKGAANASREIHGIAHVRSDSAATDRAATGDEDGSTDQVPHPGDPASEFIAEHRELRELHGRLQNLADRLGRFRQYAPIDIFG